MTILISTDRILEIGTDDQENNPIILWNNKVTVSNITSPIGVASDGAASNAANGTTFDFAQPLVSGTDVAILELDSITDDLTCAAIAAHNLGTLGANVSFEYSDNGSTWYDCGAGFASPTDDQVIIWRFPARTANHWRLVARSVTSGQPSIGVLFAGAEIIMPQRLYQGYTPPITPTDVTLQSNVSEGGHLLGSSFLATGSAIKVEINHLADTFIRSDEWTGFQAHFNKGKGFFWAWRPEKYDDAFYCWRSGGAIAPTNSGPLALMSVSFSARAYHDE